MKAKKWWITALVLMLSWGLWLLCAAADDAQDAQAVDKIWRNIEIQRKIRCSNLRGLGGVWVTGGLTFLSPDGESDDWTHWPKDIGGVPSWNNYVEILLRRNGIKVREAGETRTAGEPWLRYHVLLVRVQDHPLKYFYDLDISLTESAWLHRVPLSLTGAQRLYSADSWRPRLVTRGSVVPSELNDRIRDCLRENVEQFINDYLAANPKDEPSNK